MLCKCLLLCSVFVCVSFYNLSAASAVSWEFLCKHKAKPLASLFMCYLCILLSRGYIKEKTHPSRCGPHRVKCWFVPCSAWSIKVSDADSCTRNKQEYFSDMRPANRISHLHLHPWVLIQRNALYCRVTAQIMSKGKRVHIKLSSMQVFSPQRKCWKHICFSCIHKY